MTVRQAFPLNIAVCLIGGALGVLTAPHGLPPVMHDVVLLMAGSAIAHIQRSTV